MRSVRGFGYELWGCPVDGRETHKNCVAVSSNPVPLQPFKKAHLEEVMFLGMHERGVTEAGGQIDTRPRFSSIFTISRRPLPAAECNRAKLARRLSEVLLGRSSSTDPPSRSHSDTFCSSPRWAA